jgi:hypothetical protein
MENYIRKEISTNGSVFYYNSKDQFHRIDGPAIIWSSRLKQWYMHDIIHTKTKHNKLALFSILEPQTIDLNPTEDW